MDHGPTAEFQQSQSFRQRLELELREGDLHISWRDGANEYRNRLPLEMLDENTVSVWSLVWTWRLGAWAFAIVGALLVVIWLSVIDQRVVSYPHSLGAVGGLCLAGALVVTIVGRFRLRERILIFSRIDGSQLLSIRGEVPSMAEVQAFLGILLEEARHLSEEIEDQAMLSHERYNAATEIRKFHGLMRDSVIDAAEFAQKKKALLEGFLKE